MKYLFLLLTMGFLPIQHPKGAEAIGSKKSVVFLQPPPKWRSNLSVNLKFYSKITCNVLPFRGRGLWQKQNQSPLPFLGVGGYPKAQDEQIFTEKLKIAYSKTTFKERVMAVAKSFMGTPYVGGTLDGYDPEQLIVNLHELDCWTFVESAVAIALVAEANRGDFDFYKEQLQQLRYWGGTIDGFGSRIHYFSGWMLQQEKRGLLKVITQDLGGIPYLKNANYISAHEASYPQLENEKAKNGVIKGEMRINERAWHYIPKSKVAQMEHKIEEGDIVAMTSSRSDLDITHQGFAVKKDGRIYILHASSDHKKVMLTLKPLPDYLARNKGQSGIMVARMKSNGS